MLYSRARTGVIVTAILGILVSAGMRAFCDQPPADASARVEALERELADIRADLANGGDKAEALKRVEALEKAVAEVKTQVGGKPAPAKPAAASWADKVKVGGYVQGRFENYSDTNASAISNKIYLRRLRPTITAHVNDRTGVTIQLDTVEQSSKVWDKDAGKYWSSADKAGQWKMQLVDGFLSHKLTPDGNLALYLWQRSVPFGFDTPRSSSKILALERIEILRRMIPDEADTGVWLQYSPEDKRAMMNKMGSDLLTEGDFGMLSVGVYNGQGRNQSAQTGTKHVSARFNYPFMIGDRYAEAGVSWFKGDFMNDIINTKLVTNDTLHGAHFVLPAQPLGIEAEYYKGETGGADVDGWGVQATYKDRNKDYFFVRRDEYNGMMKQILSAPTLNDFRRNTFGIAREMDGGMRLTLEYDKTERQTATGGPFNKENQIGIQLMQKF